MKVGFSSQYSRAEHSAAQLLGKPRVFPAAGSDGRAWSPVPRQGQGREWVRLRFAEPVEARAVTVYQSHNPGSLVEVRASPAGAEAWRTIWRGERYNHVPSRPPSDALTLDVGGAAGDAISSGDAISAPVQLLELQLDTTGWSDAFWSEIDAVQLTGVPLRGPLQGPLQRPLHGVGASSLPPAALHSTAAAAAPAAAPRSPPPPPPRPYLTRQPSETARAFAERAAYLRERFGPPPADELAAMRQAALSMVWQNSRQLGCRYPAGAEERAGCGAGRPLATGTAIEGEMRARGAR